MNGKKSGNGSRIPHLRRSNRTGYFPAIKKFCNFLSVCHLLARWQTIFVPENITTAMEKVIHVLPNCSAQGTLREVLKIKGISEETLGFHHSLCHGIIPTRTTYEACVDDNFRFARPCERQWMKEDLARFYAVDFSEYEKVVVWHSNDSESQCFLYFMVSLISEMSKQDILYEADVTEILSSEELLRRSNPIDHTLPIEYYTNSDFSEAINIISKVKSNIVRFEQQENYIFK